MKDRWQNQLDQELRQAGAGRPEIGELTAIAARLKLLKTASVPATGRGRYPTWAKVLKPAMIASSGIVLGMAIITFSQSVSPTSWLYPVQKLSDNAAIMLHPEYRAAVMMRRARQVNELVASHAPTNTIQATLASYSTQAADYKSMPHANYAAFEYCQTNLRQAAASSSGDVRQAILDSLDSLKST